MVFEAITGGAITGFLTAVAMSPDEVLIAFVTVVIELIALTIFLASTSHLTGDIKKALLVLAVMSGIFTVSTTAHFLRTFFAKENLIIYEKIFAYLTAYVGIFAVYLLHKVVKSHNFAEART